MNALLRLIVVLSSLSWSFAVDDDERERLHEEFSGALSELATAQRRLNEQADTAQVVVPQAVPTQIATRRTLAADWLRRIGAPGSEFPLEEAEAFRDGLHTLRGRLDQAANWIETMATLSERWQGVAASAEFTRYRAFVRGAIDGHLAGITSVEEQPVDEDLLYRRQHRHEVILNLVESQAQLDERVQKLPADTAIVREIRTQRTTVRTTAEAGLNAAMPTDDHVLDGEQNILWLLDELLNLAEERHDRLASREQPPGAAMVALVTASQAVEEQSVRALIAHVRAQKPDDPAWHRQQESLRRARDERRRITGLAWEALFVDDGVQDLRRRIQEQLTQSPPALRESATKRATALEAGYAEAMTVFGKALQGGNRIDALRAKATLRLIHYDHEVLVQDFDFQQDRLNQENDVQARVGDAAAPTVKKQLDGAWDLVIAARTRQQEAERAVIAAELARELAESAVDEARAVTDLARQEAEQAREQLDQRREQLIDAIENPPPKPEGDPKF